MKADCPLTSHRLREGRPLPVPQDLASGLVVKKDQERNKDKKMKDKEIKKALLIARRKAKALFLEKKLYSNKTEMEGLTNQRMVDDLLRIGIIDHTDIKRFSGGGKEKLRNIIIWACKRFKYPKKEKKSKVNNFHSKEFLQSDAWYSLRYQALKKYGRRCMCCGATPDDGAKIHVDHIKPRSKFPDLALELENLQILCKACNFGKSNVDISDFRPPIDLDAEFLAITQKHA